MAIRVTEHDYLMLRRQNPKPCDSADMLDRYYPCPTKIGSGCERWIELPEFDLMILDWELPQELKLEFEPDSRENGEIEECQQLEIGFNLLGRYGESDDYRADKIHFLDWFTYEEADNATYQEIIAAGRVLKVDLHFRSPQFIKSLLPNDNEQLPLELRQMLTGEGNDYQHEGDLTVAMRLALEQILNCPFQGVLKRLYLEAKCLELITLKLDNLSQKSRTSATRVKLNLDDTDRIHWAKDILLTNIAYPPSLLELAKQVGLNDYKLKIGFRQVFNTTVFGYLYRQRMLEAGRLLLGTQLKVNEVAQAVGYANQSRFAAAFRKHFGVNPVTYRG
jgi:AraC family transcriptional regulator, transcriptional activator of the genes for pyochelin and ferripyochelin receptors